MKTYIEVGVCMGYGDGDYRVSAEVQNLSRKEMTELINTAFHAQRIAWDMWCHGQNEPVAKQGKTA